jgi:hypothetical protein
MIIFAKEVQIPQNCRNNSRQWSFEYEETPYIDQSESSQDKRKGLIL